MLNNHYIPVKSFFIKIVTSVKNLLCAKALGDSSEYEQFNRNEFTVNGFCCLCCSFILAAS